MATTRSTTHAADDWAFLRDWFSRLYDMRASCDRSDDLDDVRIGRTAGDGGGAVIELTLGREELDPPNEDDDDDEEDDGFFGTEQHIVAKVDYDSWLTILRDDIGFDLPIHWTVPDKTGRLPHMPVVFKLLLDTQNDADFLDWSSTFRHFLGTADYSRQFVEDLERVRTVVERRGVAWETVEPTPMTIRLDFDEQLYLVSDVRARLLRLADVVQKFKRVGRAAPWRGELFVIEGLEINILHSELHNHVLEGLITVVQCGVPVQYLRLPPLRSELPSLAMWATFVRLAFGIDTDDQGRIASARHIAVPAQYAGIYHWAPLCSALAMARGVDVIEFVGTQHPDGTDAFSRSGPMDRAHVWRWLAFALFSKASQTSVTRLKLDGERPLLVDTVAIEPIVDIRLPMAALYMVSWPFAAPPVPFDALTPTSTLARIPKWTILRLCDGQRGTIDCPAQQTLHGERIGVHPTTGESLVLVPGYGFCVVDEVERLPKRVKLGSDTAPVTSSFESLVLVSDVQMAMEPQALEKLLAMIGARLRSLLFAMQCGDATIARVLRLCPNLESLAISDATLESMDVFDAAYATDDAKLSSLNLKLVVPTEDAALVFLRRLADNESVMAKTLERLHWGVGLPNEWGHEIPATDLFRYILTTNQTLTHVHRVPFDLTKTFHGQRIPGRSNAETQRLVAFLGAVRTIGSLDELVRRRIWGFAAEHRHRCVVAGHW